MSEAFSPRIIHLGRIYPTHLTGRFAAVELLEDHLELRL
jgi:hypothetical protein